MFFASRDSADACKDFLVSEKRGDGQPNGAEVEVRAFDFQIRLWATVFPAQKMPTAIPYWQDPGVGISSRIALDCLNRYDMRKVMASPPENDSGLTEETSAFGVIRKRIASFLNRSPVTTRPAKVAAEDVFLYPTGMAAIYQLHRYLQRSLLRPGSTVLFGFAFHSTPHVYKEYSSTFKWFGRGDEDDLKQLEAFCDSEAVGGRSIQAVWAEFPSNPNLSTPDLKSLRTLVDKFGFLLLIDDTIASFCNADLLDVADVIITSLTKSFSGYADVMAGSVTLNPNSRYHDQLSSVCRRHFVNELYSADVEALERNSRDYFDRSKALNNNALAVVQSLQSLVADPHSAVSAVAYPAVGPGAEHYKTFMRPPSSEFTPGYGCLFSVELESIESTVAFYDNLHVHHGPHLGAPLTLALPYVKAIHAKEIPWAEECGMNERMIRISVGLEDTQLLLHTFDIAVDAANAVMKKDPLEKAVNPIA